MRVPMSLSQSNQSKPLVYCTSCRGVLPFTWSGRRLACTRCDTLFRRSDPGAAMRHQASRFLLYAVASGILPVLVGLSVAALGASHPLVTGREMTVSALVGLLALLCAGNAARLGLAASRFESLNPAESKDLERWLCPGMLRSDIVDELSRHGWRIEKIRTVLSRVSPVSRDV